VSHQAEQLGGSLQELSRTVELQPENWPAQLDLGQLLLAGAKPQEAKDRALLILHGNQNTRTHKYFLSNADAALGILMTLSRKQEKP